MRHSLILLCCLVLTGIAACSPGNLAIRASIDMALRAIPAYDRERDVEFGREAAAGQIKLLEGLLESAPDDPELLLALARSYARYAYGFLELEIERNRWSGDSAAEARSISRAIDFYARAQWYAVRLLRSCDSEIAAELSSDPAALATALHNADANSVPALFWVAFAWGNELAHQPATPKTLVNLRKTALLMQRVVELDETIMHGSAQIYLGYYYRRLPAHFGGDANRSKHHFDRAESLASASYLPAKLAHAESGFYATRDKNTYAEALREIAASEEDRKAAYGLDNAVARAKARVRLAMLESTYAEQR